MNKSGLLVRVAIVIAFASVAIGFLSSQIFYRATYNKEVTIAQQSITSLYRTIEATAATAAYLVEKDLAQEVVDGLSTNGVVANAVMEFENVSVAGTSQQLQNPIVFPIHSLFDADQAIGTLSVQPDLEYIESIARQLAFENSRAMILQACVVTIVAILVAYFLITRPMIQIARALHHTSPGKDNRLAVPDFHQTSELGELVRDVNKLLDKTQSQFEQERQLREKIEALEKKFRMLFENSYSPIALLEPRGDILLFNDAFEKLLERLKIPLKKSYGPMLRELFAEPDKLLSKVELALSNEEIATGEYKLRMKFDKQSVWVQVVISSIVSDDLHEYHQITLHDISKRKKELDALAYQADFDVLTKLYNRLGMEKKIKALIHQNHPFALLLIDLNWFKQVNDIYGHDAGDEILKFVAGTIKKSIRTTDYGGRWGGDEFVLLLSDASAATVNEIATEFIRRVSKPYFLSRFNENVTIGASIGASFFPDDAKTLRKLVNLADAAMYKIKKQKDTSPEQNLLFANPPEQHKPNP